VAWTGCGFWDLIQPSFMFMVGVAMPFSYARRTTRGDTGWRMARHAVVRALILVFLGIFLDSAGRTFPKWEFMNVLTQIGLGYLAVLLLMGLPSFAQVLAGATILVGYWAWFVGTPVQGAEAWTDFAQHFQFNENAAAHFDRWLLRQFPRPEPFAGNPGGYTTLNFVPSIVTMVLGLLAGELLQSARSGGTKVLLLVLGGAALMGLGVAAGETVCPIIKKIWSPSWVLVSGAYCVWILAAFYLAFDVLPLRGLAYPLVVLGASSILLYVMHQLMEPWVLQQLKIYFRPSLFDGEYRHIVSHSAIMGVFWLLCFWLYRQRLFIRI